jgi:hypothetical protein
MPATVTDDSAPVAEEDPAGSDGATPAGLVARITWRHAAAWLGVAAVTVLATRVVLDNFVLVEVRLPGADVRARLGWVVVVSSLVGFVVGWAVGRSSRGRLNRCGQDLPGEG